MKATVAATASPVAVNARGTCTYTDYIYTDVSRYFNFHRKAAVNARGACTYTDYTDVSRYFPFPRKAAVNARGTCTYTDYTDVSRYFNFHRKAAVNARGTCTHIDTYVWICAGAFLSTERLPLMQRARARTKIYICMDMRRDFPFHGKAC